MDGDVYRMINLTVELTPCTQLFSYDAKDSNIQWLTDASGVGMNTNHCNVVYCAVANEVTVMMMCCRVE